MKGKRNSLSSKHCEEEIDRISNLPDNLIHEILSFIDMRYAVQTCVLSKRWKNVWMSLPFITLSHWKSLLVENIWIFADEIDDFTYVESLNRIHNRHVDFVNKVFEFRDESDIHAIMLGCVLYDSVVETFNRWILEAVNHNVQDLTIDAACILGSAYEIPNNLLNCRSLKKLNVAFGYGPSSRCTDIILPNAMSLPQIKTLQLNGVSISNLELQRLFSSCPLMERVIIKECDIQTSNTRNIIIESHNLRIFVLIDNRHTHLGSADDVLTYTCKISAPNLKGFMCTGFMAEDFSPESLSSLVGAQFQMRLNEKEADETAESYSELPVEEKEVFARRMITFLGAVQNVQHLTLSSGFLEVLLQAPSILYHQRPLLCNLQVLKLEMRFTRGCLRSIAYLLKICPVIRVLKLKSKESNLADVEDNWEAEFSMCMFSHLKFVQIRGLEGCDNELKFLRFLLKNSMVLEKLMLIFQSTSDSDPLDRGRDIRRFKRNVRVLAKASSSVQMYYF